MALVACARMYAVAPGWRALFDWLARASGVELEVWDYPWPRPLADLWQRRDLGAAFMCGYPFATADPQPQLLAAAVPDDAKTDDRPRYRSLLVTGADGPVRRLEDALGGRLAYTTPGSHSGYNALRHHLLPWVEARGAPLFRSLVGPLDTPRRAAEAAAEGRADLAPVDGYAFALLQAADPDLTGRLRVVDATAWAPIPPLVASPEVPAEAVDALRRSLLAAAQDATAAALLAPLQLRRFAQVRPEDYTVLLERERAAVEAGYPELA